MESFFGLKKKITEELAKVNRYQTGGAGLQILPNTKILDTNFLTPTERY
ncbi:MAG: hypothetical protein WCJ84_06285 [Candidatus Peregrinibacteria bacterium]